MLHQGWLSDKMKKTTFKLNPAGPMADKPQGGKDLYVWDYSKASLGTGHCLHSNWRVEMQDRSPS